MMLYSLSGMPTFVPDSLKNNYLQRGYKEEKPVCHKEQEDLAEVIEELIIKSDDDGVVEAQERLNAVNLGRQYKRFLNRASRDELLAVRGIGGSTADKIIEARPLKRKTQLTDISKLANWEQILQDALEGN